MKIKGSCHCGAVQFEVNATSPYPYNRCYCSICRKTAGGGGYAINLGADYASLRVQGQLHLSIYQARIQADGNVQKSPAQRHFCKHCGSALWLWDSRWPELVHPFASAVDSELPIPPEHTHMMLAYHANWVEPLLQPGDRQYDEYPDESLADWHKRQGL